jgi:rhodanese-related sulfurtransferase
VSLPFLWRLPFCRVPEVTPDELAGWLREGRPVQLFDARTRLEYERGTLRAEGFGLARHAPLTGMPASLEKQAIDPAVPVVMLCLSGHRSLPGTRWLRARGVEAYSLKGGVAAWRLAGYPVYKSDVNQSR